MNAYRTMNLFRIDRPFTKCLVRCSTWNFQATQGTMKQMEQPLILKTMQDFTKPSIIAALALLLTSKKYNYVTLH
jgi:hypothetical protein